MRQMRDIRLHVRDCTHYDRQTMTMRWTAALVVVALAAGGCRLKDDSKASGIPAPPDVAAPPADAHKTASGLAYKILTVGLGSVHPGRTSKVRVHYTGWTTDGKMFESSYGSKPLEGKVCEVVPGWSEMLQLMVVGEKVRVWIPAELAYGNNPQGGQPAGMLVFEMELLDIG